MLLSELKDKKILLLGFGSEGQDSFLFLRKHFPEKSLGIADKKEFEELPQEAQQMLNKDNKVMLYFGPDYLKQLNKYDVLIKSPGIPPAVLKPYLKKKQTLTSVTNIFFANCPGQIIGITGTKGKSTTSSLIYEILKKGGVKAHLVGNIEEPPFQFLEKATKDDVFVYELSSFQLQDIRQSPHIAVFLNLYPEHLDYHRTFKAYAEAKANITKFQTKKDYLIFNELNEAVSKLAKNSKAQKIPFRPTTKKSTSFIASPLPALLVAELLGIPKEKVLKGISRFKPLPHRLELVGKLEGITFYNDSLATIPEATTAALDALGKDVSTLIVGGFDRGIPIGHLADRIGKSGIQTLVLLPDTGEEIWRQVAKTKLSNPLHHFFASNMPGAVKLCYRHTPKGKICLLSPAASSFNLFENYKDRGNQFKKFVKLYAKKKHA